MYHHHLTHQGVQVKMLLNKHLPTPVSVFLITLTLDCFPCYFVNPPSTFPLCLFHPYFPSLFSVFSRPSCLITWPQKYDWLVLMSTVKCLGELACFNTRILVFLRNSYHSTENLASSFLLMFVFSVHNSQTCSIILSLYYFLLPCYH